MLICYRILQINREKTKGVDVLKKKNRFITILVLLLILSSSFNAFGFVGPQDPIPGRYTPGRVGEERNVMVYKSSQQMLLDCGEGGYNLTTATFTHRGLSFLIKKYGTHAVNPYITGAILANGIYSWLEESEIRLNIARGMKGSYFHFTYRYELPYGDPTAHPRWVLVRARIHPVY